MLIKRIHCFNKWIINEGVYSNIKGIFPQNKF